MRKRAFQNMNWTDTLQTEADVIHDVCECGGKGMIFTIPGRKPVAPSAVLTPSWYYVASSYIRAVKIHFLGKDGSVMFTAHKPTFPGVLFIS